MPDPAPLFSRRFAQRIAVVTGGAQGIGFAIARRLGREGAAVWIFDRNAAAAAQAAAALTAEGIRTGSVGVDVASDEAVAAAFQTAAQPAGPADVVVNCAGIVGPTGVKSAEVSAAEFEATCRINLFGSFIVLRHAVPPMVAKGGGRVLLIASIAGKEGNAGMAAYSASKAGVIGLVKSAGKEYAETGVTINALAPATIRTEMVAAMPATQVEYMVSRIPMKRCGDLEEIASLAAWIVSPECSFSTGFTFDMTGGRAVY